jgi:hypothetical protein
MEYQEKMLSDEIKKLVPVLGKQNAEKLSKIYLISDEKTRGRIVEMVDVVPRRKKKMHEETKKYSILY